MDGHPLIKLAHMFYRVCSTIVYGKHGLVEAPRKFSPLYLAREKGFRDLSQRPIHNVMSHAFARWALVFLLVVELFLVGDSLRGVFDLRL